MNLVRNVGRTDKNIRIAAGIVLIILGIFFAKSFLLTIVGAAVLATGVLSFCGLYSLLGMNTATVAEQASASPDLSDRAVENLEDFKEEAIETAGEIKEKAEETVEDIKSSEFAKDAQEKISELKEKAGDVVDDLKSGELAQDAKEKFSELKDDAEELLDSAKAKLSKSNDKNTPPKA